MLLAYENEAITAQKAEIELDYVVPDETILIQNPAAATTESGTRGRKAFVDWLVTPEAQEIFAAKGYRSVLPDLVDEQTTRRRRSSSRSTSSAAGRRSTTKFFDPEKGSVAEIERDLGVSTAS